MNWDRYNELDALDRSGKSDEALSGLNELESECADVEDKALILMAISDCLGKLGRYPESRQAIERASALVGLQNRFYPRLAFKDAYIDIYAENWKKALSKIDAIQKESYDALLLPDNADLVEQLHISRGIVLVELHRYREALPLLEQAAVVSPDDVVVLTYLGACYFDAEKLDEAKECFLKALRLGLDSSYRSKAHYFLGSIYYAQGKFGWAKQEFENSLDSGEDAKFSGQNVYEYLRRTSQALGLDDEAERYSQLLQQSNRPVIKQK